MAYLFRITYDRDDEKGKQANPRASYSAGEWREIMLVADSKKEARKIAEERLAKQFPDDRYELVDGAEELVEGVHVDGEHRPDLAQSNYVERECVALEKVEEA